MLGKVAGAEALAAAMRTAYAVGAQGDWDGTGGFRHNQRRGAVKKPSRRESVSMSLLPGSSERPIEETLLPVLRCTVGCSLLSVSLATVRVVGTKKRAFTTYASREGLKTGHTRVRTAQPDYSCSSIERGVVCACVNCNAPATHRCGFQFDFNVPYLRPSTDSTSHSTLSSCGAYWRPTPMLTRSRQPWSWSRS